MKRILSITGILCLVTSLLSGIVYINRTQLEYNAEEKYFDPISMTNYDQDALPAYGFLSLVLLLAGIISIVFAYNISKKHK